MTTIDFEERDMEAAIPDPSQKGSWTKTPLRWRRDPLTQTSTRILTGVKLQPTQRPDMSQFFSPPAFCPFDADHLEVATSTFPPEISTEGRIRCGQAVVFPNILAYSTHSAVGIYDSQRHFLDLEDLSPTLVADALTALVRHAVALRRFDPSALWSSLSANHLPPAGASLVHPHLQSAHDAYGLTGQRVFADRSRTWRDREGSNYWTDLVGQEEDGPRWVGRIGRVSWLTPFAPGAFHEVWGIVADVSDVTELTPEDCESLGTGISRVLGVYQSWNLASFNYGLIGGGPDVGHDDYHLVVKIVSRSNPEPLYRSDATYFERIYGEALIDVSPEEVASGLRAAF